VIQVGGSLPAAAIVTPYFPGGWLAAALVLNGSALAGFRLRTFFWQRRVWAALGTLTVLSIAAILIRPDGRVHVYALDVGSGSAVVVRTGSGKQVLIDGGPDGDKFAQAIGRALPPTARALEAWVITGGRRLQIGAGAAVLQRFRVARVIVGDPDPWTPTLRNVVQQAGAAGIPIMPAARPLLVDGVRLTPLAGGRIWLIQAGTALLAVIPPESPWHQYPAPLTTAIFTAGGPPTWDGSGGVPCLAVIQVGAHRLDGLPARAFLSGLRGCQTLRPDAVGTVELTAEHGAFIPGG
jgi:hypothetical protein